MKLRDEYSSTAAWTSKEEEEEALSKFNEHKRSIWKPYGAALRGSKLRGGGGGVRQGVARMVVSPPAPTVGIFPPPQQQPRPAGPRVALKKRRQIWP